MAWRKRRNSDDGASESLGSLEIFTSGSGMIVEGSPTAVSAFVDQMLDATKEVGGRSRHFVADGVQVAANISAFRQTHREYFEFSERGRKLLKEHGAIALAQQRRQHIHSRIDAAELPVAHVTRRQGRAYTLVLHKTDALFTREQEARARDETDLEWLTAQWNPGA